HLLISYDLLTNQRRRLATRPWIAEALPEIRALYSLKEWSSDGRIMHLVRKPAGRPDLFDASSCGHLPACSKATAFVQNQGGRLLSNWDRPVFVPFDLTPPPTAQFSLLMNV